jgi:anti-anti-sigma factor
MLRAAVYYGVRRDLVVLRRGRPLPERAVSRVPEDRLPVSWSGRVAVVRMPEELDTTIADEVREELLAVLNQGPPALVLDMTRTTFCDSSGVNALVRARLRATAGDVDMRVATESPVVLRVFTLVGLTQAIDVHPDVPTALASLAGRSPRRDQRADSDPEPSARPADEA